MITGTIRAGMKDMNPAVIVIDVEQENLKISAYAKEGLTNQHTAEKAIDKFCWSCDRMTGEGAPVRIIKS